MTELSVIGKPLPMVDAREKVTGTADYTADLRHPRLHEAAILRSPHAHARILNIDASKALRLPGVKAVLTGEDTPKILWGQIYQEHYILAVGKVRFIGEEVAAVVATDADAAGEALGLIQVDYEPLPAVLEPEEAMKPDAPQVHEGQSNIVRDIRIDRGDIEAGFAAAHVVHEDTYETPYQYQAYMEPAGSMAAADSSGGVTVWSSTQTIYFQKEVVAQALGLPQSKVRVIQPFVGGGFGGKLAEDPNAPISAFLAWKTGKTVRLMNNRLEDFAAGRPRTRQKITLRMGADREGKIVAKDTRILVDNGAYTGIAGSITQTTATRMDSLYRQKNLRTRALLVFTNKIPTGAFRGFGNPQMAFALECHMDVLAERLGMDPKAVRLRNAIRQGDVSVHGWKMDSCGLTECVEKATEAIGWESRPKTPEPGTRRRGVGLGCAIHVSANRAFTDWDGSDALIKLNNDGTVILISGEGDIGQGCTTMLTMIAAEELGIPPSDVSVSSADTDLTPYCHGAWASRLTMTAGNAVQRAAADVKRQLLEGAAEMLETSVEDLYVQDGTVHMKGFPEKRLSVAEVSREKQFAREGGGIIGRGAYQAPTEMADKKTIYGNISPAYTFVAQTAEVTVDTETGQVDVTRLVAADDLGKILNPLAVEGQLNGEIVQGLGYAIFENLVSEGGQFVNGSLADYTIPRSVGLPKIETIIVETDDPNGPFGAKGASECCIVPIAAVISNAIYNAAGVRITSLPITPDKVLRALKEKAARESGVPEGSAAGAGKDASEG